MGAVSPLLLASRSAPAAARFAPFLRATACRGGLSGSTGITGYTARIIDVDVLGDPYRLRVLTDHQQFADPDGDAERAGISSAQWPLFGQLWPAGQRLAEAMHEFDVAGKRVLELGCGIGLASLVLQRRGADVLATDLHPLAETFLAYNAALNGLPALHYRRLGWASARPSLGRFDLIIAGDVLYERGQAEVVAEVIADYAADEADVIVTDAGRGYAAKLGKALTGQGFLPMAATAGDASRPGPVATLRYQRLRSAA
ncbi:methyltransferase domain-containing protein [Silanimonas sp.]|uniref:class I SAM-dependent methyltransferase n=1 Tax=Silanimonas sp. TaxID=1929290 RepID=UPI0022C2E2FC|nr:methyltransferase domain-containing protein [Silanimonas sp.]MCZ8113388.1 methyltransferase domain-containing protein [Silanimonas sp.]